MGSELIGSNVDGNFDGEGDGKSKNDLAHISILTSIKQRQKLKQGQ